MARTVYVTTELTGGGSGLDGVNGNVIVAGDMAFYINKTSSYTVRRRSQSMFPAKTKPEPL